MAWSINDLSSITDALTSQIDAAIAASPLNTFFDPGFKTSGLMPSEARDETTPQLNLYLLHVSRDPYWRNTPTAGNRAQTNDRQPLSLNLSYLLTAYAKGNYNAEQRLMSIALAHFHNYPIYTNPAHTVEWTITVEADSIEEMSRLWQAITVPIRLSAMFRVAVVFLSPPNPPLTDSRPPREANISVDADLGASSTPTTTPDIIPQLSQIALQTIYSVPPNSTDPSQIKFTIPPQPAAVAGSTVHIHGGALDLPNAAAVYLSDPVSGNEWPVTAWRVITTPTPPDELVLHLLAPYATLPATGTAFTLTPPPGIYKLTVGPLGPGFRSSPPLTFAIAPVIDGVTNPAELQPDGSGIYTLKGRGFIAGQTSLSLDETSLTEGALAVGFFALDVVTSTITFMPPTTPPGASGTYVRVRVIVNSVEAPPNWWVKLS